MRYTTFVVFAVSFMLLSGCATQGRLTSLTFQQSSSYETLDSSMEKLKSQYESSLQEQFSALREMRYLSKHMEEPGKREMALQALTFFAFVLKALANLSLASAIAFLSLASSASTMA